MKKEDFLSRRLLFGDINMPNHQKKDPTTDKEFERLREESKEWVRLSKSRGYKLDSMLTESYSDPSHFIYEILQNAEDVEARKVEFKLFENRLDIYHDGNLFNFDNIRGVTGIGISQKENNLNAIGKFGMGFKSVFAVTDTPYIFSGKYRIRIDDFVIPSIVDNGDQFDTSIIGGTLVRLPFNCNKRSPKESFDLISNKLRNIGLKTLLFLKNIEVIQWQIPSSGGGSSSGSYSRSSRYFQETRNTKKVIIKSSDIAEEYIVIEKPVNIGGKKLKVEVAYRLDKDKRTIVQEPNSKLVVFFPTDKDTYLNFAIQGPYKTTPNRADILLGDEQNKAIIDETGDLVAESLPIIKDLGYLDVNFLKLLPIKPEHMGEQIYPVIYQKVKEKLLSEELLPTSDHKYTKADNSLLARGKELTEFLGKKDIQKLFSKQNWLDSNITYDKTRELRDYFTNELKIGEVGFENFADKITIEFIQTTTDKWMLDFYKRLLGQEALWNNRSYPPGVLRTKPIIRLETGEHIAPFDDKGEPQVYLPSGTKPNYKTVKGVFARDKNSSKFLEGLGITKPDLFAEINERILPKYQTDNHTRDDGYIEHFEKFLKAYKTISSDKKHEFIGKLSKAYFIDSVNNVTGEHYLRKPLGAYFKNKDLEEYFSDYNSVYFVSGELYEKFKREELDKFLKELGVEDKPRRVEILGNLSEDEKRKIKGSDCSIYGYDREKTIDYEFEGLESFMKEITAGKSSLLWKFLLKNAGQVGRSFFRGEFSWFFHTQHSGVFNAKFLRTLKSKAWLVDKNNNLKKPGDITCTELPDEYIKENPNIDILLKALEFRSEAVDQLPEDQRRKLEITKDFTPEQIERALSEHKKRFPDETEKIWMPEYEPGTFNAEIIEVEPNKIFIPDLTGQGNTISTIGDNESIGGDKEFTEENTKINSVDRKAIGDCGEKQVYHELKEKYQKLGSIIETYDGFKIESSDSELFEIVWLNKHSDKGRGCDFIIKRNGKEVEYIEVKTKTQENAELIEVTGAQWELARSLFEKNEGDKYSFYVVLYAKKQLHIRRNPAKLWIEGNLYAHPVNFRL